MPMPSVQSLMHLQIPSSEHAPTKLVDGSVLASSLAEFEKLASLPPATSSLTPAPRTPHSRAGISRLGRWRWPSRPALAPIAQSVRPALFASLGNVYIHEVSNKKIVAPWLGKWSHRATKIVSEETPASPPPPRPRKWTETPKSAKLQFPRSLGPLFQRQPQNQSTIWVCRVLSNRTS